MNANRINPPTQPKLCKFCSKPLHGGREKTNGKHPRCQLADVKRRLGLTVVG